MGSESSDDAGAYLLRDDLVLLQSVDVIAPIADDPVLFGQVAAANALSDIYAMGGTPATALNLAFFPRRMPMDMQRQVLQGAAEVCEAAGAAVAGGHTIEDPELKFGLAVSGVCRPDELLRNSTARPGDVLVLTKPIGTGLLLNGMKAGKIDDDQLRECWQQMRQLNDAAGREAVALGASAATDITGFGLGGHAAEMARGSTVCLQIDVDRVPVLDGALDLQRRGISSLITDENRAYFEAIVDPASTAGDEERRLLADPQTSGGLLVALPPDAVDGFVERLRASGASRTRSIGEVLASDSARLRLR